MKMAVNSLRSECNEKYCQTENWKGGSYLNSSE